MSKYCISTTKNCKKLKIKNIVFNNNKKRKYQKKGRL